MSLIQVVQDQTCQCAVCGEVGQPSNACGWYYVDGVDADELDVAPNDIVCGDCL